MDEEVSLAVVKQQHFDGAAVVGVNDARACIDEVLGGQARTRRDTAVLLAGKVVSTKAATAET